MGTQPFLTFIVEEQIKYVTQYCYAAETKSLLSYMYHISLNISPGFYFLPRPWRPGVETRLAFNRDQHL